MFRAVNVTPVVEDLQKSVCFYFDQLGLKLGMSSADRYAELLAPGVIIVPYPGRGAPNRGDQGNVSIGFTVDRLDGRSLPRSERIRSVRRYRPRRQRLPGRAVRPK
jgi:catechol 2,3-dioxygenase-like lactoylglutathione lyase family enzyme